MKMLKIALALAFATALTATAAEGDKKPEGAKRPELTAEQKSLMEEIKTKYDANKDGKLSPDERKAISADDKAKMEKAGLGRPAKKAEPAK